MSDDRESNFAFQLIGRAEDCPPYLIRISLVGRVTPCAPVANCRRRCGKERRWKTWQWHL